MWFLKSAALVTAFRETLTYTRNYFCFLAKTETTLSYVFYSFHISSIQSILEVKQPYFSWDFFPDRQYNTFLSLLGFSFDFLVNWSLSRTSTTRGRLPGSVNTTVIKKIFFAASQCREAVSSGKCLWYPVWKLSPNSGVRVDIGWYCFLLMDSWRTYTS